MFNIKLNATARIINLKNILVYFFIALIISVLLSACGGNKTDEKQVTENEVNQDAKITESTKATSVDIATEVQINREKWQAHEIGEYQIEMQKICYCVPEVVRMMVFEVNDDDITSVRYADDGEMVDPQHYGQFNTVESMFTFVEQALDKNPADISISYDDKYGYIKELSIDFKENIADDEISIIASNMRPITN